MPKPKLTLSNREWQNWHLTKGVGGKPARFYTVFNQWADGSSPRDFKAGIEGLKAIVIDAERADRRVHAVGGGWSLNNVAYTKDYFVNTTRLSKHFVGIAPQLLTAAGRAKASRLVLAQCGVQIKTLNNSLHAERLALPTSGASNGQTIVGATATGTHGSANGFGSMHDAIRGLHIVAENGKSYWIERSDAGNPALVTKAFCDALGAEPRPDTNLFNAAVVSFGSFGLVHAVLIEAEPIYLLERWTRNCDYSVVRRSLSTLDMSGLGLPEGNALPFHFEVVLNPYRLKRGQNGAFLRVYYKRPAPPTLPTKRTSNGANINSPDLVALAGVFTDIVPNAVPDVLQGMIADSIGPTGRLISGTPGQQFGDSAPTGGGTSLEIGVPLQHAENALNAIVSAIEMRPFGAPVAFRYVKASSAYLSMACFDPVTCVIEMPGIDSQTARDSHQNIFKVLRDKEIPHVYHWGQVLPLNPRWVRAGFGDARVDSWLKARREFLSADGRHTFSNELLDSVGLNQA